MDISIQDVYNLKDYVRGYGAAFSPANTKLEKLEKKINKRCYSFDLLSGYTCPMAKDCKAFAIPIKHTRMVVDGPDSCFRCYSASQEAMFKDTFNFRLRNTLAMLNDPYNELERSLPSKAEVIRIHAAGDFFSFTYFNTWLKFVKNHNDLRFYTYTKMIPYLLEVKKVPDNLKITLSYGGKADHLINDAKRLGFYSATVVQSEAEAAERNLPIDSNDYHAYEGIEDYALLIHGTQPAKTKRLP